MKACKIISARSTPNDAIYTPLYVAQLMIEMCDIKTEMKVLDPRCIL